MTLWVCNDYDLYYSVKTHGEKRIKQVNADFTDMDINANPWRHDR